MPKHRSNVDEPTEFFSTYDVAKVFEISVPTARKWMKEGRIANAYLLPGSNELRVSAASVLAFAKRNNFPISDCLQTSADIYNAKYKEDGTRREGDGQFSTGEAEDYSNKVIEV